MTSCAFLFIGNAMIDFTPLLANPTMMLFGAAAQFGIFFTLSLATLFGFSLQDAASVGITGLQAKRLHQLVLQRCCKLGNAADKLTVLIHTEPVRLAPRLDLYIRKRLV